MWIPPTCEHGGRAGRMQSGLLWCPICRDDELYAIEQYEGAHRYAGVGPQDLAAGERRDDGPDDDDVVGQLDLGGTE